jgi:Uma2 family endonuclease
MSQAALTVRRWKRVEYERLIDLGVFKHDPIELIAGQLVVAEPQSAYHAAAIRAVDYTLRAVLPPGWIVSIQSPVSLDDESEPEPDLAVVPGRPGDYRHDHPAHPALVVEVAESSVAFDRTHKGSLYARAQIPDYWVVNLGERVLEVYREPAPDPSAPYGWSYRSVAKLSPLAAVTLSALTCNQIAVADLLP